MEEGNGREMRGSRLPPDLTPSIILGLCSIVGGIEQIELKEFGTTGTRTLEILLLKSKFIRETQTNSPDVREWIKRLASHLPVKHISVSKF